jgi:hypothetical protein
LTGTILLPDNYFFSLVGEIANISCNAKEGLRQGEFIIDFLKSGKHLFMV